MIFTLLNKNYLFTLHIKKKNKKKYQIWITYSIRKVKLIYTKSSHYTKSLRKILFSETFYSIVQTLTIDLSSRTYTSE